MKEYTVKEFVAATGKTDNIIRHQIRNNLLKTVKKGKLVMIQYDGDPKKYVNIKKPARSTYVKGSKKGLLTFVKREGSIFICDCDCGKTIKIKSKVFYNGNPKTLSCGCNKELIAANSKLQKFKPTKGEYLNNINKDIIHLCKRFGVINLLNLDDKTFNNREIEVSEKQYVFKDDNTKLIQYIYKKYGYKRLSFQEELVKRRT